MDFAAFAKVLRFFAISAKPSSAIVASLISPSGISDIYDKNTNISRPKVEISFSPIKSPMKPPLLGIDCAASARLLRFSAIGSKAAIIVEAYVASAGLISFRAPTNPFNCFPNNSAGSLLNPKRLVSPSNIAVPVRVINAFAKLSIPSKEPVSIPFSFSAKPAIPSPYPIKSSDENPPAIAPINRPMPLPTSTNLSIPFNRKAVSFPNSPSITEASPTKAPTTIAKPPITVRTPVRAGPEKDPIAIKNGDAAIIAIDNNVMIPRPTTNLPKLDQLTSFICSSEALIRQNIPAVAKTAIVIEAKPGINPLSPDRSAEAAICPNLLNAITSPPTTTNPAVNLAIAPQLTPSNVEFAYCNIPSIANVPIIRLPRTMNPGIIFLTRTLMAPKFEDIMLNAFNIALVPTLNAVTAPTDIASDLTA